MDPDLEVKGAQQDWAISMGIAFDPNGYVAQVENNLWQPLSSRSRSAFSRGAGAELSGHMRALHSSTVLAVNLFEHWTDRDSTPILAAFEIEPSGGMAIDFEAQFPTGLRGVRPHLDVAITSGNGFVVAIESKFTEHLKRSARGKSKFPASYFPQSGGLWAWNGLPACQTLAELLRTEELRGRRQRFEYLDARQLLKHALGLAAQLGREFSLCYLYYDWPSEQREAHRREIGRFNELVGGEIGFRALSYQQVFSRLQESGQASGDYLEYLGARYFASKA